MGPSACTLVRTAMTEHILINLEQLASVLRNDDPVVVLVCRRGRIILLVGTADAFRYYEVADDIFSAHVH
jgi:hypothetical protein